MPKWLLIDEFRVGVLIPAGRSPRGVRATLTGPRFLARLREAVRAAVGHNPPLRRVRVTVSR